MSFTVDSRIQTSSAWLGNWPLSSIYLKNDANFSWGILVPRKENIQEIYQLSNEDNQQLILEISTFSKIMKDYFNPDKLNIAALGNIVSQLHIHVVARFTTDAMWPQSIWQANVIAKPYALSVLEKLTHELSEKIAHMFL